MLAFEELEFGEVDGSSSFIVTGSVGSLNRMTIPESQLETWCHQWATTSSQNTHQSIRNALSAYNWPIGVRYDDYLQGSYRNTTNIRANSDIDLVVELESSFNYDDSLLSATERQLRRQEYLDSNYGFPQFKADVLLALQNYYGADRVRIGRKSLKVTTPYLAADVVPCIQYRKYQRFINLQDQSYIEGIQFYVSNEGRWVINYPKLHYEHGTYKSSATSQRFKRTVRLFKNSRSYMAERNRIETGLAPSYFVECLIYNVPHDKFRPGFQDTFVDIVNWLETAPFVTMLCQNEQTYLFGTTDEQWSETNAHILRNALVELWNNWTH